MKPEKVTFYIYADDESEILSLQQALYEFVRRNYENNTLITADKLKKALNSFGSNPIVTAYFNGK